MYESLLYFYSSNHTYFNRLYEKCSFVDDNHMMLMFAEDSILNSLPDGEHGQRIVLAQ